MAKIFLLTSIKNRNVIEELKSRIVTLGHEILIESKLVDAGKDILLVSPTAIRDTDSLLTVVDYDIDPEPFNKFMDEVEIVKNKLGKPNYQYITVAYNTPGTSSFDPTRPVLLMDDRHISNVAHAINQRLLRNLNQTTLQEGYHSFRSGSSGEQVTAIQQMLKQTIMPNMAADGVFGPATREAVKAFQRKYNLEETGEVDERTFERLKEAARNADLPPAETTFEPETEQITGDSKTPAYWILKLNPANWELDTIKPGMEAWFHSHDLKSQKRVDYDLFAQVKTDDIMFGFAFEPVNAIICSFRVAEGLHNTNLGEGVRFVAETVFEPHLPREALEQVLEETSSLSVKSSLRLISISQEQHDAILKSAAPEEESISSNIYLSNSSVSIRDGEEPMLGVKEIAKEVAGLIHNLKTKETGRMVGVFGHWGRGKTFLVKQIKEALALEPSREYVCVDFHAWKYQDTHASWAYLYQAFAKKYFEKPVTVSGKWKGFRDDFRKRFRLNMQRHGSWPLIRFGISFAVLTISALIAAFGVDEAVVKAFWLLLTTAGIADAVRLIMRYFKESQVKENATEVFKQYFEKPSFKDLLGIQAEIQGELSNLLTSWITEEDVKANKKQILLFVDDIDRCSEDRIVQLIDALRVMLEDEEISKRVIVIAAIDERVLRRAIKWKYKGLLDADRLLNPIDLPANADNKETIAKHAKWHETTLQITSEYMDKLFLAGIKLGTLNGNERKEILKQFTKNKVQPKPIKPKQNQGKMNPDGFIPPGIPEGGVPVQPLPVSPPSSGKKDTAPEPKNDPPVKPEITTEESFELGWSENEFLLQLIDEMQNLTPRQVRIFYYRYMLARNILTVGLRANTSDNQYKTEKRNALLGQLLSHYTNLRSNEELLDDRKKLNISPSITGNTTIGKYITSEDPLLVSEILEALEMVIAY